MRPDRIAAIVGVAESDLGLTPGKTVLQLQAQAARAALADAGLEKRDVDALFVAGNWAWSPNLMLAEYLGIQPRYTDGTNIGGSSFEAHLGHALAGIAAGCCEVALITYGSTQRSDQSRNRPVEQSALVEQYERPYGLPAPVGAYALAAMRHMYQYGTTSEQLAEIAVATRKWAMLNSNVRQFVSDWHKQGRLVYQSGLTQSGLGRSSSLGRLAVREAFSCLSPA